MMKRTVFTILVISLALGLSSCATPETRPPEGPFYPVKEFVPQPPLPILRQDTFHIVAPGETLWRIGKMYDVKVEDLMAANNISAPKSLETGQRLRVPHAGPLRPVVSLYLTSKWKYIIIHHSASDTGSALSINNMHYTRGFDKGLGYHFVIDNGTKTKEDGQIEASPRWIKQMDGAHTKASGMNHKGIGICLVGNFSREQVSEKQLDSLVYLVNILRKFYHIPPKNVLGHGQVYGARTECPGNFFPYQRFRQKLDSDG